MSLVKRVIPVAFVLIALAAPTAALAQEAEPEEAPATVVADETKTKLGVGARVRYVFMPEAMLDLFLDHATGMSAFGFGIEVVRRKADFDIVFGLEYDSIAPENGLYLESGDDPGANCLATGECPDYTEFEDFALLGLDVSFIWHYKLHEAVQLRYGAGIGVGLVLGELYQTDTSCPPGTTIDDLEDPQHCTTTGFARVKSDDVPPVVPIVNLQLGARFKVADQLTINLEGGFRDVFFIGLGTDYIF